ncbi:MAG: peptidase domain-containing ABC transporter [Clostridia bacterium]|nr:peptidase domain-containing ABC transporter [Clostridia bacterium]
MMQTECGLCCITMIANYYGHHITLSELRDYQQPGRDGVSVRHLCDILDWIHFDHKVYRGNVEAFHALPTPFMIHLKTAHFVIVEKTTKKAIYLIDPSQGRMVCSYEEMSEQFSGVIISATPSADLKRKPKERSVWWKYLWIILKQKWLLLGMLVLSAVVYGTTLLLPMFTEQLINGTSRISIKLLCGVVAAVAGYGIANLINGFFTVLLRTNLFQTFYRMIIDKTGKMEYQFFESRTKPGILFNLGGIETVNQFYAGSIIRFFVAAGALAVQLIYIASKNIYLFSILLVLILFFAILMRIINKRSVRLNQTSITRKEKFSEVQLEFLEAIESIKVANTEEEYIKRWKQELDLMVKKDRKMDMVSSANSTVSGVLISIIPLFVLFAGIWMADKGMVLLGTAVALYSVAGFAVSYSQELVSIVNYTELVGAYMERIKDILIQRDEIQGTKQVDDLQNIELKDLSFRYNLHAPLVLRNINMNFGSGKKIAIVGGSGSGKSTIAKLIAGLYYPTKGHLLFNDIPERELDRKSLKGKLFMVPQDGSLFKGSLRSNLTFFNKDCPEEKMLEVCKSMQILDDIMAMPMKFETPMWDVGTNISGGQKQRIILARAILAKPQFLVLDEATSSLDSVTERAIFQALRKINCTQIVIAHRLSTIEDADYIYVLKDGELVEEGTHDSLMALSGEYAALYLSFKKKEAE